jgi:hypothetical protein
MKFFDFQTVFGDRQTFQGSRASRVSDRRVTRGADARQTFAEEYGPGLIDGDTASWLAAVAANSGTVSTAWATSVDTFVRGCKTDGIWDSLLDVGLLCGADNLNGALVKLKTPTGVSRILTNNNFVSGDYTASGATAGLKGNGTNKWLNTNTLNSTVTNLSFSAYVIAGMGGQATNVYQALLSSVVSAGNRGAGIWTAVATTPSAGSGGHTQFGNDTSVTGWSTPGHYLSSFSGSTATPFRNGAANAQTLTIINSLSGANFSVFAINATSGLFNSPALATFYHIGTALTAPQISALSTRVNALMTTIGANQY